MSGKEKKYILTIITQLAMILIGIVMLYPLIWMLFSAFKTNA